MKHLGNIKIQLVAVAALAVLAAPVAQAKDVSLRSSQSPRGETAQALKADGLRMQAIANAYRERGAGDYSYREDRQVAVQLRREAAQLNQNNVFSSGMKAFRDQEIATQTVASSPAPISENSPVELQLQPNPQPVQPVAHTGFDWGDAGIGAGIAALATALAALGAGGIVRRRSAAHA
jgi:hypothetical protein